MSITRLPVFLVGAILVSAPALVGAERHDAPSPVSSNLLARLYPEHVPFQQPLHHNGPDPAPEAEATSPTLMSAAHGDQFPTSASLSTSATTGTTNSMGSLIITGLGPELPTVPFENMDKPASFAQAHDLTPLVLINPTPQAAPALTSSQRIGKTTAAQSNMIHINHADIPELIEKLKIDARRARLIMEFRQAYGPFRVLEDLAQVNGITDEKLETWEKSNLQVILD